MTLLSLTKTPLSELKVDALVIGVATNGAGLVLAPGAADVDKALGKKLVATLTGLGATGKTGELTRFATLGATKATTVVAVGLGAAPAKGSCYDPEQVRRGLGAAIRSLAGTRTVGTALAQLNGEPATAELRAVAEGALLGGYGFTRYRTAGRPDSPKPQVESVTLVVPSTRDKATKSALERATVVAGSVSLVRDLVNTPAVDLHPADLVAVAKDVCTAAGCSVDIYDEKALAKGGHGGILGVGQGAAHPPRLARIAWSGGRGAKRTIHLVGKGITFDSGGLSLKQPAQMEWMKADMGGAAAVIATLQAVARLGLAVNVVGWVASAENMPSGTAIRPSDVLVMRGGKTVEVMNTDAEGRLVMADAIVRAAEESPDAIVDVATLTGAQLVALGARVYAVMSNDDDLREQLVDAAALAGEQGWPMPLPPELRKSLDSEVADISNVGDRYGGMLVAGLFLQEFVPDGVPWAHLDIAGPAWNEGEAHGYTPHGGTGVPVRSLVQWLEGLAADKG
jgi:leucyl aminopeptidase